LIIVLDVAIALLV